MADFRSAVKALRRNNFRPPYGALTTVEDTRIWIDLVGFCLLMPHARMALPNLAENTEGRFRLWRDSLVESQQVYYGRTFRQRAGFVSLNLLPALYALSPTAEYGGDRFQLFQHRFISADANRIAGIVLAKGPLPSRTLQRESGMAGTSQQYRFRHALIEAESRFLIVKTGMTQIKESNYTNQWDALVRHLPQISDQAASISVEDAARQVLTRYVELVGASIPSEMTRSLRLNLEFVRYMLNDLTTSGKLRKHKYNRIEYAISHDLAARMGLDS